MQTKLISQKRKIRYSCYALLDMGLPSVLYKRYPKFVKKFFVCEIVGVCTVLCIKYACSFKKSRPIIQQYDMSALSNEQLDSICKAFQNVDLPGFILSLQDRFTALIKELKIIDKWCSENSEYLKNQTDQQNMQKDIADISKSLSDVSSEIYLLRFALTEVLKSLSDNQYDLKESSLNVAQRSILESLERIKQIRNIIRNIPHIPFYPEYIKFYDTFYPNLFLFERKLKNLNN
jgi:DNA repair ATPase RecN